MQIKIIAFGQIAEITTKEFSIDATDVNQLQSILQAQFPELKEMKYVLAVNNTLITGNQNLKEKDTVALMPPYSGG